MKYTAVALLILTSGTLCFGMEDTPLDALTCTFEEGKIILNGRTFFHRQNEIMNAFNGIRKVAKKRCEHLRQEKENSTLCTDEISLIEEILIKASQDETVANVLSHLDKYTQKYIKDMVDLCTILSEHCNNQYSGKNLKEAIELVAPDLDITAYLEKENT